jgi:hypothetical protein
MRVEVAVGIVRLICARWVIVELGGIARTSPELQTLCTIGSYVAAE